jgi:hypothetical protein
MARAGSRSPRPGGAEVSGTAGGAQVSMMRKLQLEEKKVVQAQAKQYNNAMDAQVEHARLQQCAAEDAKEHRRREEQVMGSAILVEQVLPHTAGANTVYHITLEPKPWRQYTNPWSDLQACTPADALPPAITARRAGGLCTGATTRRERLRGVGAATRSR